MSERFAHHRLDVYELALDLAVSAKGISEQIPRGYRSLSDQLIRSGSGVVLLIAEGANRFSSGTEASALRGSARRMCRSRCDRRALRAHGPDLPPGMSALSERRRQDRCHAHRPDPTTRMNLSSPGLGPGFPFTPPPFPRSRSRSRPRSPAPARCSGCGRRPRLLLWARCSHQNPHEILKAPKKRKLPGGACAAGEPVHCRGARPSSGTGTSRTPASGSRCSDSTRCPGHRCRSAPRSGRSGCCRSAGCC